MVASSGTNIASAGSVKSPTSIYAAEALELDTLWKRLVKEKAANKEGAAGSPASKAAASVPLYQCRHVTETVCRSLWESGPNDDDVSPEMVVSSSVPGGAVKGAIMRTY